MDKYFGRDPLSATNLGIYIAKYGKKTKQTQERAMSPWFFISRPHG